MIKPIAINWYKSFIKTEINLNFYNRISLLVALNRLHRKSKLPKKNKIITVSILGYKILAYNYSTLYYLINEIFIGNEYFFKSNKNNPLIIDCGANIGISVLYFKKTKPSCRILAFEPNPYAFKLLNENIRVNNITGVETYEIALMDEEKNIPFFIRNDIGTPSASIRRDRGGETQLQVQTQKLSTYLKNLESVDLVKIDVEGAEKHIIKDLIETSTIDKIKNFYIEYHHNLEADRSSLSSFLNQFESNGFSYKLRGNFRNSRGRRFQNIFIHFFKEQTGSTSTEI